MKTEVRSAVEFLSRILKSSSILNLSTEQLEIFSNTLQRLLRNKYENHWFPEKPFKGSGFRCIRINHKLDPLVREAGISSGLQDNDLINVLPKELTLWVDPNDVSYRIGENGSIGILFNAENSKEQESQIKNSSHHDNKGSYHPGQSCKEQMMSSVHGIATKTIQEFAPFVYS